MGGDDPPPNPPPYGGPPTQSPPPNEGEPQQPPGIDDPPTPPYPNPRKRRKAGEKGSDPGGDSDKFRGETGFDDDEGGEDDDWDPGDKDGNTPPEEESLFNDAKKWAKDLIGKAIDALPKNELGIAEKYLATILRIGDQK